MFLLNGKKYVISIPHLNWLRRLLNSLLEAWNFCHLLELHSNPLVKLKCYLCVFLQVFNEISSRDMDKINVFNGILNNYVFVSVLGCTVLFQIIIVEFLGTFASTCPLTWHQWFTSVAIGFLGMPIAAAIKMIPVGSTWNQVGGTSKWQLAWTSLKGIDSNVKLLSIRSVKAQTWRLKILT